MTSWLVVLAYLAAWAIAAIQANSSHNYYYHPDTWACFRQIGVFTPLWWAVGLAIVGFVFGEIGVQIVEDRTKKTLGFGFLDDNHWLTQQVHGLADKLGLPRPRVGYMNKVNAFAVGTNRNDAIVILGTPLVKGLRADELDAVIGHELGHIASGDMRGMIFADGYQNMFSAIFATFGVVVGIGLAVLAKNGRADVTMVRAAHGLGNAGRMAFGLGSELLQRGLSRKREFYADAVGAALSSPDAMSRALQKLGSLSVEPSPAESRYACLMFRGSGGDLMSTHPTTESRIAALQSEEYLGRMKAAHKGRHERQEWGRAIAQRVASATIEGARRTWTAIAARKATSSTSTTDTSQVHVES